MERRQLRKVFGSILLAFVVIGLIFAIGIIPDAATASEAGKSAPVRGIEPVVIRANYTDNAPVFRPPPAEALAGVPETATINVNYVGAWDPQAQTAFQHAVDIWETLITSPVTIEVNAEWNNLGGGILGSAGAEVYFPNFSGAPVPNTMYPVALANKLAGTDLDPGFPDINANFNSAFPDWYFGTDGMVPFNKWDFVSVVLHEIGHGLGFAGSMRVGGFCGSGLGCWGFPGDPNSYPTIYDRFTKNGGGTQLLSCTNFSTDLATQLTGGDVYFDGPLANVANLGQPVKLYAPGFWQQGSSYSHLDEIFNGTSHALMTFSIDNGEANHHPGLITLGMFEDMAWDTIANSPTVAASNWSAMGSDFAYLPALLKNNAPASPCASPQLPSPFTNPGFESGPTGWTEFSAQGWPLIINSGFPGSVTPHGGSWATWLGGDDNEEAYIQQSVTVPAGAPYLSYWHWIASEDTCGSDFGSVQVNGSTVDLYDLCLSANTFGWVKHVVDLGAHNGQTVAVRIRATTDGSLNSNLFVDDVGFQASPSAGVNAEKIVTDLTPAQSRLSVIP